MSNPLSLSVSPLGEWKRNDDVVICSNTLLTPVKESSIVSCVLIASVFCFLRRTVQTFSYMPSSILCSPFAFLLTHHWYTHTHTPLPLSCCDSGGSCGQCSGVYPPSAQPQWYSEYVEADNGSVIFCQDRENACFPSYSSASITIKRGIKNAPRHKHIQKKRQICTHLFRAHFPTSGVEGHWDKTF